MYKSPRTCESGLVTVVANDYIIITIANLMIAFFTAFSLSIAASLPRCPVIYHDFEMRIPGVPKTVPKIPIGLLTLAQFKHICSRPDSLSHSHHPDHPHPLNPQPQTVSSTGPQEVSSKAQARAATPSYDDFGVNLRRRDRGVGYGDGGDMVAMDSMLTRNHSEKIDEIRDSFPTLKECFERVPGEVGFNIELKYPPGIPLPSRLLLSHHNYHNQLMPQKSRKLDWVLTLLSAMTMLMRF